MSVVYKPEQDKTAMYSDGAKIFTIVILIITRIVQEECTAMFIKPECSETYIMDPRVLV